MLHDPSLFRLSRADTRPPTVIMWLFCETLGLQKSPESHKQDFLPRRSVRYEALGISSSLSQKATIRGEGQEATIDKSRQGAANYFTGKYLRVREKYLNDSIDLEAQKYFR